MSVRSKSLSRAVMPGPDAATAPVMDGRLFAWTLVAAVLVALAIYSVTVGPAADVSTAIGLVGL